MVQVPKSITGHFGSHQRNISGEVVTFISEGHHRKGSRGRTKGVNSNLRRQTRGLGQTGLTSARISWSGSINRNTCYFSPFLPPFYHQSLPLTHCQAGRVGPLQTQMERRSPRILGGLSWELTLWIQVCCWMPGDLALKRSKKRVAKRDRGAHSRERQNERDLESWSERRELREGRRLDKMPESWW